MASPIAARTMGLIVSNPPYVPLSQRDGMHRQVRSFESHVALLRQTAFEPHDRMVADAPCALGPGGWLILELGFGSLDHVKRCLAGWDELHIEPDLASIPRVIVARSRS